MQNKKKRRLRWLIPLLAVILLGEGFLVLRATYTLVDGKPCRLNAQELDLRDAGLSQVENLEKCRNLQWVDLRGNDITPQAVEALQEALPDCEIRWDVPLGGAKYDSALDSLELEDLPADWENILLFPSLKLLRVEACTDYETMAALRRDLPEACQVEWNVELAGTWYSADTRELSFSGQEVSFDQLSSRLGCFSGLEKVTITGGGLSAAQQRMLLSQYPEVTFLWSVEVGDLVLDSSVTQLSFQPGDIPDLLHLEAVLDLLPSLKTVDLTGCAVSGAEMTAFRNACPGLEVTWTVELGGQSFSCDTQEIDLSGVWLSAGDVENALSYLPELSKIVLCDCGISNEDMDALVQAFPQVRLVWRVYFGSYSLRTDATSFIAAAYENGSDLYNADVAVLKYCVDLQGIDCGHMSFNDISFFQYMPNMQYVILAECPISDLTPLTSCPNLKYLEIFHTNVTDLSPLLECRNLEDLNISYTPVSQQNAWDNLSQMTWLDRLWYCSAPLSAAQLQELQALMPECEMYTKAGGEPTGSTWRYHEHYYAMRDLFGMYYMPGGTNGVDEDGNQIIVDEYGREHHLVDWDGNPNWWEDYGIERPF